MDGERRIKIFWFLVALAFLAGGVASIVGIWFAIADPDQGTDLYDALGGTAAFFGLTTGLLFGVAAIYAQIAGVWQRLSDKVRIGAYVFIFAVLIAGAIIAAGSNT